MDTQDFRARPFGRKPWRYERRRGKGAGKADHFILNDADGRYLGSVVVAELGDEEAIARTVCRAVSGAETAGKALDETLAKLETEWERKAMGKEAYGAVKAGLLEAKRSLNGNGGRHA